MDNPIIQCKNITCTYGNFVAVENVSFAINHGDYLCVVGANGSGKSTLVKTILGLNKNYTGQIITNTTQKGIGYLPQQRQVQKDFPASVYEVVLSGCLNKKRFFHFYTKNDKDCALLNMEKLSITNLKNLSFRDLSGGQQQRVLLARALCAADNLLVLDEPVTGLDPTVTDELYSIIKKLNSQDHLAIIMVSHDIHRAIQNSSHILHMSKTALFFGTSEEYQKTDLFTNLSHVEVCSTHCSCECDDSSCNASHIVLKNHHHS